MDCYWKSSAYEWARAVALALCKQIVIPFAVGVRTEVRVFAGLAHHADVTPLAAGLVHGKKLVFPGVDLSDDCFSDHSPPVGRIVGDVAYMGDVFMWAVAVKFIDAGDLIFSHKFLNELWISALREIISRDPANE
jgi:hypothetical protein